MSNALRAAWWIAFSTLTLCDAQARDPREVRHFRDGNPCPATSRTRGACPGWQVDHIQPLCAGGEDKPANMHWLSTEDHRFKTLIDVQECRKLRRMAETPAAERSSP